MGPNPLPLMLLLISNIYSGHCQVFKPNLTVNLNWSQTFRGETVTLRCDVQGGGWIYAWDCDDTVYSSNEKELKFTVKYTQTCRCYAGKTSQPSITDWSNALTFTVIERPNATVTVEPDKHVFNGEIVTLLCEIPANGDTRWTYSWFEDGFPLSGFTNREFRVRIDSSFSGSEFTCRGERKSDSQKSGISDAVTLTVSDLPPAKLIIKPETSVLAGETVTLKCEIESDFSNWRYRWCKGSAAVIESERYTLNRDTLTIRAVTDSDEDQYWCRGERDERPATSMNTSLTLTLKKPPVSVHKLLSFLLAASPYLLASVILGVKCCRAKGQSDVMKSHYAVTWEKQHQSALMLQAP